MSRDQRPESIVETFDPSSNADLWNAYRATVFEADIVDTGEQVLIRIEEACPALEELLEQHNATSWIFITAWNPGTDRPTALVNQDQNKLLRDDLAAIDAMVYPGRGRGEDPAWEPEESFLALGVSLSKGIELGQKYAQSAIVAGTARGVPQLVDCKRFGRNILLLPGT